MKIGHKIIPKYTIVKSNILAVCLILWDGKGMKMKIMEWNK